MKSTIFALAVAVAVTNALPVNIQTLEKRSQNDTPREIWGNPSPTIGWALPSPTSTAVWAAKPSSSSAPFTSDNQIFSPNPRPNSSNRPQSQSKPEPHIITPIVPSSSNPRPSNPRPIVPEDKNQHENIIEDHRQVSRPEPHVIMPQAPPPSDPLDDVIPVFSIVGRSEGR